jgi:hypothetical protein
MNLIKGHKLSKIFSYHVNEHGRVWRMRGSLENCPIKYFLDHSSKREIGNSVRLKFVQRMETFYFIFKF